MLPAQAHISAFVILAEHAKCTCYRGTTDLWYVFSNLSFSSYCLYVRFNKLDIAVDMRFSSGLQTGTHGFLVLAEEFGAGQELVVLAERDHRFRKLPQIELQQRGHRVHVRIAAQRKDGA